MPPKSSAGSAACTCPPKPSSSQAASALVLILTYLVKRLVKAAAVSAAIMGINYVWYEFIPLDNSPKLTVDGPTLFNMFVLGFLVALPLEEVLPSVMGEGLKPACQLAAFVAFTAAAVAVRPKNSIDLAFLEEVAVYAIHGFIVTLGAFLAEYLLCITRVFSK